MDDHLSEHLNDMFKSIMGGRKEPEYEPYGPLSADEIAEYESLKNERASLEKAAAKLQSRTNLFWSKIELSRDLYNKRMHIENGLLMVDKEIPEPTEEDPNAE